MVDLRLFGSLNLTAASGDALEAVARQSKRVGLLAYLAAAQPRGLHRRDRLLALFWPDAPTARARAALNQAIYVLRSALGAGAIVTRGNDEVGLDPQHVSCDVARFEAALDARDRTAALALYRGDLLEGFFIAQAPEFEQWVDRERARLRQRASEGAWALAEEMANTDAIGAARLARRAAELLPADEAVIRRLMSFLHRLGDRAAAIRAYEAYAWQLAREYELEPSTETHALAGAIRREVQRANWTLAPGSVLVAAPPAGGTGGGVRRRWVALSTLGAILVAAAALVARPDHDVPPSPPVVRVTLEFSSTALSAGIGGSTVALSPDGARLAYLMNTEHGPQIFIRPLNQAQSVPVSRTAGASVPFFSPDGAWLGFVADGRIRKVPVDGGPAITVTELDSNAPGISWGAECIVFASGAGGGLWRVPAAGGRPQLVARPDSGRAQRFRWPEVLPDGRAAVFTIADNAGFRLAVVSLDDGAVRELGLEGTSPRFVAPNHLIFARMDGALLGVAFDPRRRAIDGPVFPITDGVMVGIAGAAKLGVSRSGVLAYVPEFAEDRALVMVDRNGVARPLPVAQRAFGGARFSPDGTRIAVGAMMPAAAMDVWTIDLRSAALTRVTFDSGAVSPVWSADGKRLAFSTKRGGTFGFEIRSRQASGADTGRTLLTGAVGQMPAAFTPDGRVLIFERLQPGTRNGDVWMLPLNGGAAPQPYLQTRFDERGPALSPDGRWLAYVSDRSGRAEVYVSRFPDPSVTVQVSAQGGSEPRWAPTGHELFYRSARGLEAVSVELAPTFDAGPSHLLFRDDQYIRSDRGAAYDIHPDGQRFLMTRRGTGSDQVVLLLNSAFAQE